MKTLSDVGDALPHSLLADYVDRYEKWMQQRYPATMGWKEVAYGYTIALVDNIAYLLQQCDYDTRTTLIFQLKAKNASLWTRVQQELSKPDYFTS